MATPALAFFTGKPTQTLMNDGGTSSWVLDRNKARNFRYAVCVKNQHADWSDGDEEHGAAFVVGKISDVVPSAESPDRWLVKFSEYAVVNVAGAWKGWRNPVRYTTMEELGIDFAALSFKAMPAVAEPAEQIAASAKSTPMTIAQAKAGLALTFGVSPDAIEIIVRG